MWIRTFNKYTIKMNVLQSLGSRVWNCQLKLRKKILWNNLILQKVYRHKFVHSFATKCFLRYINACPTFNVRKSLLFRLLILNMTRCLLTLCSLAGNIRRWIGKQTDGSVPNFWSAALSKEFCSHYFLFFFSAPCSILAKSDDEKFSALSRMWFCRQSLPTCSFLYWTLLSYNCYSGYCWIAALLKAGNFNRMMISRAWNCVICPVLWKTIQ